MAMIDRYEVMRRTTFANASLYRTPDFPEGYQICRGRTAWDEGEIEAFLLSRPKAFPGLILEDVEIIRPVRVLTITQVEEHTSLSRSQINRMFRDGTFPAPIKLSTRKIGFLKHELDAWLKTLRRASSKGALEPVE